MSSPEPNTPEYWKWREEKRAAAMLLGCSFDESCNCFYDWEGQQGGKTKDWLDADTMEPTDDMTREKRRLEWSRQRLHQQPLPKGVTPYD